MLDWFWDHLGIIFVSRLSFQYHVLTIVGSCWDHVGFVVGSFRNSFGIMFGSCWNDVLAILRSVWDQFGFVLGSFRNHFGISVRSGLCIYVGFVLG